MRLNINRQQYLELNNVAIGAFAPLSGFMTEDEFGSVVRQMRLPEGDVFPLPVVLDLSREEAKKAEQAESLKLVFQGIPVGEVTPRSIFTCDKEHVAQQVFGTGDPTHPGVAHWLRMSDYFVGGPVRLNRTFPLEFAEFEFTPEQTRAHFVDQGWETVVGFQTRNVPHRAHEHMIRLALEHADGIFIQPLVGTKKRGDYAPLAVLTAYRTLIEQYLPRERVLLGVSSTAMRYAGPREAVFHAIIRRNFGCTHFIIGRDHAGVGDYYGEYAAQELTQQFEGELGINIMRFPRAFFCSLCNGISTEQSCCHWEDSPHLIEEISGTRMREILSQDSSASPHLMRAEIADSLCGIKIFIDQDAE